MNRRQWLLRSGSGLMGGAALGPVGLAHAAEYRSPYGFRFRWPQQQLAAHWERAPWNRPQEESAIPSREWYGPHVRRHYGAWGPPARHYPPAPGFRERDATWLQDRVILAASRWIGYPYQHHHIPDWDPPANWPWHPVKYGRNSMGVDCSNFSSFYYNYALGVKLDTGIRQQAGRRVVRGPGGHGVVTAEVIELMPYRDLVRALQPADLLYIRNNTGKIAHVIMWLGEVGQSPDGAPLVLDSTGAGHVDAAGQPIPIGVHVRPFTPESWYARDFAHAHHLIRGVHRVRPGEAPAPEEGDARDVDG